MRTICQIIAGSRLYGLDTPESDTDTRGVFLNTEPENILGLGRFEIFKKESEDLLFFEFRHFLSGLRKTNTQMIEILFAEDEDFSVLEPEFKKVRENKLKLIDSQKLFKSLVGYIENERRLALGERTGQLGGKRKQNLDKYGFSPKNFSHLFRLAKCGTAFFETGSYPVNMKRFDPNFRDFIFSVKTEPEKFNKEHLNSLAQKSLDRLKIAFDRRKQDLEFDYELANSLCLEFHAPFFRFSTNSTA